MEKRILKPYHGIVFFVIMILALLFPGAYMQTRWGMVGLAASEIMFLIISLLYVLILRGDIKSVFPVKRVKATPCIGTALLWIGTLLVVMVLTMIITCLFPEQMLATSQDLNSFFGQVPLILQLMITAVLPAICEEAMHRGVILNSFMVFRNKWFIIISVGILFGINHLSVWRFVPTALLGVSLTYVVYETGNIFYSVLFHFLNNAFATLASSSSEVSASASEISLELFQDGSIMSMVIGMYMIMASVAPFLIYTAAYLIRLGKRKERKVTYWPSRHKGWMVGILISLTVILLAGGFLLMFGGAFSVVSSLGAF